ncbi:MAG TPA: ABC transporter substrate-binding protein [Candidatus Coprenecus merdigallinarum]|nr:ABC transporter substrate-binding protein [Candidatus Coprenecus merdigallinarum]
MRSVRLILITVSLLYVSLRPAHAQKDTIVVMTQWLPQCQFAGIIMAYNLGFYDEAGIEAELVYAPESISSTEALKDGSVDIITSMLVDAIIARDMGLPVINILQTSYTSGCMIISRTPLENHHGLNGKRIGRWVNGFSETAMGFASNKALDVEWVSILSNIYPFVEGAVDAMVAMEYNEYFQIMMAGIDLTEDHLIYLRDEGYDIPEDGLYTTEEYYSTHKDAVDRFVQATIRGWEWVRDPDNFDETAETITEQVRMSGVNTSLANQEFMLRTILRLQEDDGGNVPFHLDKPRFDFTVKMLRDNNFILSPIEYGDFVKERR